jgi:hypothetical protein
MKLRARNPVRGGICQDNVAVFASPENEYNALALCSVCNIQLQCLAYALQENEGEEIWGGTTPKARRAIVKRMPQAIRLGLTELSRSQLVQTLKHYHALPGAPKVAAVNPKTAAQIGKQLLMKMGKGRVHVALAFMYWLKQRGAQDNYIEVPLDKFCSHDPRGDFALALDALTPGCIHIMWPDSAAEPARVKLLQTGDTFLVCGLQVQDRQRWLLPPSFVVSFANAAQAQSAAALLRELGDHKPGTAISRPQAGARLLAYGCPYEQVTATIESLHKLDFLAEDPSPAWLQLTTAGQDVLASFKPEL